MYGPASSFANVSPRHARAVLSLFALATLFCVGISLSPWKSDHREHDFPGEGDLPLYRAEAQRMQAGEAYYPAVAQELRARGYPMQSPFNWRTPLPLWLFGRLPVAVWLLGGASLALLLLSMRVLVREAGPLPALCAAPLLIGALAVCVVEPVYYLTELWAGVFIALSLCCYALDRRWWGVAAGLAAQVLRELSLIYSLIALGYSIAQRRYREAAVWLAGLGLYAAFLVYHAHMVQSLLEPGDRAQLTSWVQFGGAAFVISTAQVNSLIINAPQWVAALYLCLALLGLAGWNTPAGQRLGITVAAYVLAFGIVGCHFNQYWGAMYAPLLCLGAVRAPRALADLWSAADWGFNRTAAGSPV